MTKKAVFFDIDGTLLDFDMKVEDSTKKAIRELQKNDIYTFICTGRCRPMIPADGILNLGFDGIVGACGTYIEYHGDTILNREFEPEQAEFIAEVLRDAKLLTILEGVQGMYLDREACRASKDTFLDKLEINHGHIYLPLHEHKGNYRFNKCSIKIMPESDYERAQSALESLAYPIFHGSDTVEFVPNGYNKATGIQFVCEHLGIEHKNTYAFGDSNNDLEMLEYAACGIAMGNGTKTAKEAADYITDDIHEDGIYNALKHFKLI